MKKMLLVLTVSSIIMSCSTMKTNENTEMMSEYKCGTENIKIDYIGTDKVKLTDGAGMMYKLKREVSASGEKYGNKTHSIHVKGNYGVYEMNGKEVNCEKIK